MALWDYIRSGDVSKSIQRRRGAASPSGDYGTLYRADRSKGPRVESFDGHGLDWDTVQGLIDAWELPITASGNTITITSSDNRTWTGNVVGVKWTQIKGSDLWNVTLQLEIG